MKEEKKEENIRKGIAAEIIFEEYLDSMNIPFMRIDQNVDTKYEILKEKGIKRPDYFIPSNKNLLFFDVKYRNKKDFDKKEQRFYLNQYDIIELYKFHKEFKQDLWIVFFDSLINANIFYSDIIKINNFFEDLQKFIKDKKMIFNDNKFIYIPKTLLCDELKYKDGNITIINKNGDSKNNYNIEEETKIHCKYHK
ncbi:MAG: hypothetical protein FWB73_01885 [Treponema sp.]|nr:hypothetical protein [Treponema sp.]